jgi:2-polyprenyl-3-methyl-5-hydroxy-6-metoxy-1,4-benzoquinol methylase
MFDKLRSIFFSVGPARRALARVTTPHYTLAGAWKDCGPARLGDLPPEDVARINRHSDDYFDDAAEVDRWLRKPLSDLHGGADGLWRFGLLVSALKLRPEDRVLDFGCGTGWTTMLLAQTGAEVVGMDISAHALNVARQGVDRAPAATGAGRLRFEHFDGTTIRAPDGHFDVIVVIDAFHHLPNPRRVLEECVRVLGPHGVLGFAEPGLGHSESYTAQAETAHGVLEGEVDIEQLRTAALAAGFAELEMIVPPVPPNILTLPMPRARWYLRGVSPIVPHDYIRAAMLTSPIGILRKGPYVSTTLHPHTLIARLTPAVTSLTAQPGSAIVVRATVTNLTGTVWLRDGRRGAGGVRLGALMFDAKGGPEGPPLRERTEASDVSPASVAEWESRPLPRDLRQGESCDLEIHGAAPSSPGTYRLRLDMLVEGIAWFHERGSTPVDVALRVDPHL